MAEMKDGCVTPVKGPIMPQLQEAGQIKQVSTQEEVQMLARVGKEAPDFEANAFVANEGFKNIQLSDYKGKWIVLCFYPGDFTFV